MNTEESKVFTVSVRYQYPAWDEREGIEIGEYEAKSKKEAIRNARFDAERMGLAGTSVLKGLQWWSAK